MRTSTYLKDIEGLLQDNKLLAVADFVAGWPGVPMPTVYSRIRFLLREGKISPAGRGLYWTVHKPTYSVSLSDWMKTVNNTLIGECVGIDHCLYEKEANLYVEAFKSDIPQVLSCLKSHYSKVLLKKDADAFPSVLEGFIIVGPLVSDTPLMEEDRIAVPTLEKTLVDKIVSKDKDEKGRQFDFQKAMEIYPVNVNRMIRYAARRGVKEELSACLDALDAQRIQMFSATQKFLSSIPVLRAWVFGSLARGEETPESDLDLLVDYDKDSKVSLLDIIRYKNELSRILGREVDLIENGCLKPFAVSSAEHDKYQVYER